MKPIIPENLSALADLLNHLYEDNKGIEEEINHLIFLLHFLPDEDVKESDRQDAAFFLYRLKESLREKS